MSKLESHDKKISFSVVHREETRVIHGGGKKRAELVVASLGEFYNWYEASEAAAKHPVFRQDSMAVICPSDAQFAVASVIAAARKLPTAFNKT